MVSRPPRAPMIVESRNTSNRAPREQPRVNFSRSVNQRGREFERVALVWRPQPSLLLSHPEIVLSETESADGTGTAPKPSRTRGFLRSGRSALREAKPLTKRPSLFRD